MSSDSKRGWPLPPKGPAGFDLSAELSRKGGRVPTPPVTRRAILPSDTSRTRPSLPRVSPKQAPLIASLLAAGSLRPPSDPPSSGSTSNGSRHNIAVSPSKIPSAAGRMADMLRISEQLAGEVVDGRYRIESPLGQGAAGFVFRAVDLQTREPVAIKLLDRERVSTSIDEEAFVSHVRTVASVESPHVVRIVGAGFSHDLVPQVRPSEPLLGPVPYIVMELLEGTDLRALLQKSGPMLVADVVSYLRDVATALDAAHAVGLLHCDLKPGNLFLASVREGEEERKLIKVLDFGRTRMVAKGFFGTAWYMAPEQARAGELTPATDRWALAFVAFRLLTGESYWSPAAMPDLLAKIIAGPPDPPSKVIATRGIRVGATIGPAFDEWFFHACQLDPALRFESCSLQVESLARALVLDGEA